MANTFFLFMLGECSFLLGNVQETLEIIKSLVVALHSQELSSIARVKLLNCATIALSVVVNLS